MEKISNLASQGDFWECQFWRGWDRRRVCGCQGIRGHTILFHSGLPILPECNGSCRQWCRQHLNKHWTASIDQYLGRMNHAQLVWFTSNNLCDSTPSQIWHEGSICSNWWMGPSTLTTINFVMVQPLLLPFPSPSSSIPCPSPSPTSNSIQPCPLALCLLHASSKAYSCNYTTSTVGLAPD